MGEQEKILKYLQEVESLAAEILSDKHEIIALDKRRNSNREALRKLGKDADSVWLTVGSVLIKRKVCQARILLEKDQIQLDIDINKLRSNLKVKVNALRDLEMQPSITGFMLAPMSNKDIRGIYSGGLLK